MSVTFSRYLADTKLIFGYNFVPPLKAVIKSYYEKKKCARVETKSLSEGADLQACNFIKKILQHRCFPVNIAKLLRTPVLKNICERLLLQRSPLHKH